MQPSNLIPADVISPDTLLPEGYRDTPITSVGIGLRSDHYEVIKTSKPAIPWFEVLIDNYLDRGGQIKQHLHEIRSDYPITFHGVGMSLGSTDPLNKKYLAQLKRAIHAYEPIHISDHLCWTGFQHEYAHDLLPLPYTQEAARHVANNIMQVQDILGQNILVENVSSYMQYRTSEMSEAEFVRYVCELADCHLLLDINNVYVSAFNHKFNAQNYLATMPAQQIKEIHLAGYEDHGDYLLDTHGQLIHPPVWDLYKTFISWHGVIPTLIEWDTDIPDFSVLQQQARQAEIIQQQYQCHVS